MLRKLCVIITAATCASLESVAGESSLLSSNTMATALATDDPTININVVVDGVKKNLRGDSPAHMYPHHAHEGEG